MLIPGVVLVLLVAVVGLLAQNLGLKKRFKRLEDLWSQLSSGVESGNLEELLHQQLRHSGQLESDIQGIQERLKLSEAKLIQSKRYVGLIRYDAFEDVGGSQSFAMAICDENGDGAIVTSQVGRMDNRVFGKSLRAGRSEINLTAEEEQALEEAVAGRNRPKIGL
ncbi:MAG: DUF4446 family protein [Fimbriimonadaceae bacterium]